MDGEWISGVYALAGAAIGGFSTYYSAVKVRNDSLKAHAKAIKSAISTEIISLAEIARYRNYEQGFKNVISYLETQPDAKWPMPVNVPSHYSRIYQENAKDIGLLEPEYAVKVVKFYQFIDAVVQDIIPGGNIYQGGDINAYRESLLIFQKALEIADEIKAESP